MSHSDPASGTENRDAKERRDGPTILMVEDEPVLLETIAECLREWGYHVLEAQNAAAAICHLRTPRQVDVLFTDIRMPGKMDGFGLARWVRERYPAMPILITTGYEGSANVSTTGLFDPPILRKPYDLSVLRQRLSNVLQRPVQE
jgi:CheY-like chemotaxis protein